SLRTTTKVDDMKSCPVLISNRKRIPRFSDGRSGLILFFVLTLVSIPVLGQDCRNSGADLSAKSSLAIQQTASGLSVAHLENSQAAEMSKNIQAGGVFDYHPRG